MRITRKAMVGQYFKGNLQTTVIITGGQSYKRSTIINYNAGIVLAIIYLLYKSRVVIYELRMFIILAAEELSNLPFFRMTFLFLEMRDFDVSAVTSRQEKLSRPPTSVKPPLLVVDILEYWRPLQWSKNGHQLRNLRVERLETCLEVVQSLGSGVTEPRIRFKPGSNTLHLLAIVFTVVRK